MNCVAGRASSLPPPISRFQRAFFLLSNMAAAVISVQAAHRRLGAAAMLLCFGD